jgi:hypothetical protein
MTIDGKALAREFNSAIERHLVDFERQIRNDLDATGPEDEAALDRPPELGSAWSSEFAAKKSSSASGRPSLRGAISCGS